MPVQRTLADSYDLLPICGAPIDTDVAGECTGDVTPAVGIGARIRLDSARPAELANIDRCSRYHQWQCGTRETRQLWLPEDHGRSGWSMCVQHNSVGSTPMDGA
jgi:hypothetical protein